MDVDGEIFEEFKHPQWFNLKIAKDLNILKKISGLINKVRSNEKVTIFSDKYQKWWSKHFPDAEIKNSIDGDGKIFELSDGTILSKNKTEDSIIYRTSEITYLSGPGIYKIEPFFIRNGECRYDNLINILILVKDAGDNFEQILRENIPYMDRWTIMDTGSTDGTLETIKRVLEGIPGKLYQEDFVDFKYNRNKLLEYAGEDCEYNIMLDDTYILKGKLREFLEEIRGDTFGDSYSLSIFSDDIEYCNNRITRSCKNLKYIFRIHEVIQKDNNINVNIPNYVSSIIDVTSGYMRKRTEDRKLWDLKTLAEEYSNDPSESRHLYYMAQTYKCLKDWPKTYEYYLKRAHHLNDGFLQEKIDSIFEAARTANFQLNLSWKVCKKLYKWAYELDNSRPDSLYFLGVHYLETKPRKAYEYFKKAFEIGYPIHAQFSLKPTLSFHYLPKFLTSLCYQFRDYETGLRSAKLYLDNNDTESCRGLSLEGIDFSHDRTTQESWFKIFSKLVLFKKQGKGVPEKPIIVFCVDGNWKRWTGSDIEKDGLGGSETWAVETANVLAVEFDVYVFCNCSKEETYGGVKYRSIGKYLDFLSENYIYTAFVSRYSEWLPVTYEGEVQNVYLWVHDLTASGNVIVNNQKLKGVYCLSQWHANYLLAIYPSLPIKYLYYGFDPIDLSHISKVKNSFIYSSTANRGLINIIDMWFNIREILPDATLEIFCDLNLPWANNSDPKGLARIKSMIPYLADVGVTLRGWCSKKELYESFASKEYWLYPCTFAETFCLTALEAAAFGVIPITNGLAALSETASHGVTIRYDPGSPQWFKAVLEMLKLPDNIKDDIIVKGKEFSSNLSWKSQTEKIKIPHVMYGEDKWEALDLPSKNTLIIGDNGTLTRKYIDKNPDCKYYYLSETELYHPNMKNFSSLPFDKEIRYDIIHIVLENNYEVYRYGKKMEKYLNDDGKIIVPKTFTIV